MAYVRDEELAALLRGAVLAESEELQKNLEALRTADLGDVELQRAAAALRVESGVVVVPPGWRLLDDAAHQRIAARLGAHGSHAHEAKPVAVTLLARPWRTGAWSGAVLLATAASLALMLLRAPEQHEPIPSYAPSVEAGLLPRRLSYNRAGAGVRGPDANAAALPDEIVLRPAVTVSGPLAAAAYLRRGEVVAPWTGRTESGDSGSIRLLGLRRQLESEAPGEVELLVAVGRPGALPKDGAALLERRSEAAPERGWVVVGLAIHIE